jgi:steroid delta-isomerase-like uncharacterized protein
MSAEANKSIVRRLIDMTFNKGLGEPEVNEVVADNYVEYLVGPIREKTDRKGYLALVAELRAAFPDMDFRVEDMIAEGDLVASRNIWYGTHTGPFRGMPPSGKKVTVTAMGFSRIKDGKVVEHWGQVDFLGLLQQIGVLPSPKR